MSWNQFLVMAVAALLITAPVILVIPRARTSPAFDLLLWAATFVVGFLLAWVAVGMARAAGSLLTPAVGDTPILPALIAALAGALAINVPLWLADRVGGRPIDDYDEPEVEPDLPVEEQLPEPSPKGEPPEVRPQPPS